MAAKVTAMSALGDPIGTRISNFYVPDTRLDVGRGNLVRPSSDREKFAISGGVVPSSLVTQYERRICGAGLEPGFLSYTVAFLSYTRSGSLGGRRAFASWCCVRGLAGVASGWRSVVGFGGPTAI